MNTNINLKFNIILLMVIVSLSYFMFGELLQSKFSIIDDHHIVAEVGSDGIFTVEDGLNLLKNEKDFQLGVSISIMLPLTIISANLMGYFFLNENVSFQAILGMTIIFIGLAFIYSDSTNHL